MFKKIFIILVSVFIVSWCSNNIENNTKTGLKKQDNIQKQNNIQKQENIKSYNIEIKDNPEVPSW